MGQNIAVNKEKDLALMAEAQIYMHALLMSDGNDAHAALSGMPGIEMIAGEDGGIARTRTDANVPSHDILPSPKTGDITFGDRAPAKYTLTPRTDASIGDIVGEALHASLDAAPVTAKRGPSIKTERPH